MPQHPDQYAVHSAELVAEGDRMTPFGRCFMRLWMDAKNPPRVEILRIDNSGRRQKFQGQLTEVQVEEDD